MIINNPNCEKFGSTKVEEEGKSFEIKNTTKENRTKLRILTVDGCLDITSSLKCDYIMDYLDDFICYIELKGKDISHAAQQLIATIRRCPSNHKYKYAVVVSSKNNLPKSDGGRTQKIKQDFKKIDNKIKFHAKNTQSKVCFNELKIGNIQECN